MQERAEELMEQVRSMFKDTTDILQTMDLVDSIQLLGLSYHFEKEISEALNRVHDADFNDHDLYDTALRFRLLRQQGYHVTPGNMLLRFLGVDVFVCFIYNYVCKKEVTEQSIRWLLTILAGHFAA